MEKTRRDEWVFCVLVERREKSNQNGKINLYVFAKRFIIQIVKWPTQWDHYFFPSISFFPFFIYLYFFWQKKRMSSKRRKKSGKNGKKIYIIKIYILFTYAILVFFVLFWYIRRLYVRVTGLSIHIVRYIPTSGSSESLMTLNKCFHVFFMERKA